MYSMDFWRLSSDLTIVQAALLLVGEEPTNNKEYQVERTSKIPEGYEGARAAITTALKRGLIAGKIIPLYSSDIDGSEHQELPDSIDVRLSTVEVEPLIAWLARRGVSSGFFFPNVPLPQGYLDPSHPRYAPKLAAAVRAWLSIDEEPSLKGKSPKQALARWLRENAAEFGLVDDDGKPNETGC